MFAIFTPTAFFCPKTKTYSSSPLDFVEPRVKLFQTFKKKRNVNSTLPFKDWSHTIRMPHCLSHSWWIPRLVFYQSVLEPWTQLRASLSILYGARSKKKTLISVCCWIRQHLSRYPENDLWLSCVGEPHPRSRPVLHWISSRSFMLEESAYQSDPRANLWRVPTYLMASSAKHVLWANRQLNAAVPSRAQIKPVWMSTSAECSWHSAPIPHDHSASLPSDHFLFSGAFLDITKAYDRVTHRIWLKNSRPPSMPSLIGVRRITSSWIFASVNSFPKVTKSV